MSVEDTINFLHGYHYAFIDKLSLLSEAQSNPNLRQAILLRGEIETIDSEIQRVARSSHDADDVHRAIIDKFYQANSKCEKAIDLLCTNALNKTSLDALNPPATGITLEVLCEMKSLRSRFKLVIMQHLMDSGTSGNDGTGGTAGEVHAEVLQTAFQCYDDAVFVINMANVHSSASPAIVRRSRMYKMHVADLLHNKSNFYVGKNGHRVEKDRLNALNDVRFIIQDPMAKGNDRLFAMKLFGTLDGMKAPLEKLPLYADRWGKGMEGSFLDYFDLCQVEGLNVGRRSSGSSNGCHFLAVSYVDQERPVRLRNGEPFVSPSLLSDGELLAMSPSNQDERTECGPSGWAETVLWKQCNGVLLGKHKWEYEHKLQDDDATLGELWDMRWVMKTKEDALKFHDEMLRLSRQQDNSGYLENSMGDMKEGKIHDSVLASVDEHVEKMVFCANEPKPKSNCVVTLMAKLNTPQPYLHQFCIIFVVDRVVVKLFLVEGFDPRHGLLTRSCLFGPKGLINIVTKVVLEWLEGKRKQFDYGIKQPNAKFIHRCANCGVRSDVLKNCSRCKSASYCGRECQVKHYKIHKQFCKSE